MFLRWIRHSGSNSTTHVSSSVSGHPPAEWVQTIDKQDVMGEALQLHRDAGLMASNPCLGTICDVA